MPFKTDHTNKVNLCKLLPTIIVPVTAVVSTVTARIISSKCELWWPAEARSNLRDCFLLTASSSPFQSDIILVKPTCYVVIWQHIKYENQSNVLTSRSDKHGIIQHQLLLLLFRTFILEADLRHSTTHFLSKHIKIISYYTRRDGNKLSL